MYGVTQSSLVCNKIDSYRYLRTSRVVIWKTKPTDFSNTFLRKHRFSIKVNALFYYVKKKQSMLLSPTHNLKLCSIVQSVISDVPRRRAKRAPAHSYIGYVMLKYTQLIWNNSVVKTYHLIFLIKLYPLHVGAFELSVS